VISVEDYLFYVDEALDGMIAVVTELGDDRANQCVDGRDTSSPYAVLTHCLGVMEYWAGHLVAGRTIERDRDAEFVARGAVADLVGRVRAARAQLAADIADLQPFAPLRNPPDPDDAELPFGKTQGAALIHVFEELAQHRGQIEGHRDVLMTDWARTRP
jgi:uncharacterized damage-inducible protein DinB